MSLIHIGVALGLSAGAAFLVTGAAMRPIEPSMAADCAAGPGGSACAPAERMRIAGGASGGSSLRLDTDRPDHDRRFYRGRYQDCHREVSEHYVPGYGVVSHLHVGPDCKVRKAYRSGSG